MQSKANEFSEDLTRGLYERLLTDDDFAHAVVEDPVGALAAAGYQLDDEQVKEIERVLAESEAREENAIALVPGAIPAVGVAVRVGTSPGTRPAVASSVEVRVSVTASTLAGRAQVDYEERS
jgi:hypothetical protein